MCRIVFYIRRYLFFLALFTYGCATTIEAPVSTQKRVSPSSRATVSPGHNRGFHVVVKGDTLYSIAWRYSRDYKNIARWNGIAPPYVIYPGQVIRLKHPPGTRISPAPHDKTVTGKKQVATAAKGRDRAKGPGVAVHRKSLPAGKIKWQWPTHGKLVKLNSPTSKKGVNISGKMGQAIKAAAAGNVVYSGSGLLGYGKLIIIKHNDTYLSAYAHNSVLFVKEGARVTLGQKIATMGRGSNGKPVLHFEIRRDGKPVDPLTRLPRKRS
ncbi:MAG: peptidoglycan DD-metalloendopeptidase family protein [Gammaproteobacteria bacterium]